MKLLKGLNTDTAHVDQPGSTYRRSRNMILDDLAGALAVEKGTSPISYFDNNNAGQRDQFRDYAVIGQFKVPGDRIILGMKKRILDPADTTNELIVEVVPITLPDGTTTTTLTRQAFGLDGTFGWNLETPIQAVGYVNAAGETILAWSDGVRKPRWINMTSYAYGEEPNLIFAEAKFPMPRPIGGSANDHAGEILGGSWSFMLTYEVVDGTNNITQYGPTMGAFRIGNVSTDENATFKTTIGLKFYGLDTRYTYARVYGVRNYNGTETVHYCDRFRVIQEDQEWTYIGQTESDTDIPSTDALYIPRANYKTAETITVSDDRLFMANLTSDTISQTEGRTIANQINMNWTVDMVGLTDSTYDGVRAGVGFGARSRAITSDYFVDSIPKRTKEDNNDNFRHSETKQSGYHQHDNFGLLGGFMPDSVYAFYVSFLLKDGQWSEAFHIPASGTDGVFPAGTTGLASQVESNASISDTIVLKVGGRTGWVANATENYADDYNEGLQSGSSALANNPVRHHRMPTTDQMYRATRNTLGGTDALNGGRDAYTDEWANQYLGIFASNVIIPDAVAEKIQGYKIFYAKPNTINDRRVKGYVPEFSWSRWANLDSSDTLHGTRNISVNALRVYDPYIRESLASDLEDWTVSEVYKNMAFPSSPLTGQSPYQTSTVTKFNYLPSNVTSDGYDNTLRESVLAISLDQSPTAANGWMTGWPGYFPGTSAKQASTAVHGTTNPVWISQPAYDAVAAYDMRASNENGHGANFASSFGSAHRDFASSDMSATNAPADKTSSLYGTTFAGTYKTANDNAAAGVSSLRYIGPGNMMGYVQLACDYDNYFENYASQELVATNDLVHIDGAGTYTSNTAVLGGDTFISPVVIEFMAHRIGLDPDIEPINEQASLTAQEQNNCELGKISYFTYTYLPSETRDLRETENLDFFGAFASEVGSNTAINYFSGQFLNDGVFGQHYVALDDTKAAFPFNPSALSVSTFPNRIIRSAKQGYETTQFAWNSFAYADYYDNALAKEQIRNVEDYKGDLIIHHQNAIFKTRSKFTFDAGGTDVFVGTGDIFQAPPLELFPDAAGYAGIAHWGDSLLCRAGYTWVDREGKKVYLLGSGLEELSANGMRDYFRDDFCNIAATDDRFSDEGGYSIGYDPEFDRLFFTGFKFTADGETVTKTGETLSYSMRNKAWASMHDRLPTRYAQSYSHLFFFDEYDMRSYNNTVSTNNYAMLYQVGNANPGVCAPYYIPTSMPASTIPNIEYNGNNIPATKSFVDVVFNMGGPTPKVWQNFNWISRSGDGEGDLGDSQFENMTVYNDYQLSDTVGSTSLRKVDNRWNFNNFRDIATGTGSFILEDGFTIDTSRQNDTKKWYEQGRFISEYAIIRLETLNTTGDSLYLTDVSSTARKAQR